MDKELIKHLQWFASWHGRTTTVSVMSNFLTGRYRITDKDARRILRQAEKMGLVKIRNDVATIVVK